MTCWLSAHAAIRPVRGVRAGIRHDGSVDFAALEEIHAAALRALPADVAAYLEEGAGSESTLRANREAFGRWIIRPRPMSGVSDPDMSATVLGIPLSVPILTAPFGGDALFHPDGQLAVARANAASGTASIVPEVGSFSYEAVRAAAPSAARIAQVHPYESFPWVAERIRDAGYDALCVTVDCPQMGFRTRSQLARFHPDYAIWAGNATGDGRPSAGTMFRVGVTASSPAWSWARLAQATTRVGLPWIAKG